MHKFKKMSPTPEEILFFITPNRNTIQIENQLEIELNTVHKIIDLTLYRDLNPY